MLASQVAGGLEQVVGMPVRCSLYVLGAAVNTKVRIQVLVLFLTLTQLGDTPTTSQHLSSVQGPYRSVLLRLRLV